MTASNIVIPIYSLALWLGLYLVRRDPRSPLLLLTRLGLVAYALALACDLLAGVTSPDAALVLLRLRWPLLLLPALCWTGALIYLLPEDAGYRERLSWSWRIFLPLMFALLLLLSLGTGLIVNPSRAASGGAGVVPVVFGAVVLLPMLVLAGQVWRATRRGRTRRAIGLLIVVTLFVALSTGLQVVPLGWLPRPWTFLALGIDLLCLGLAIAAFDAFDQGESLLSDMMRAFDAALLAALVFGGQVALVIVLATGPTVPMLTLLLAAIATIIAAVTFGDALGDVLDRLALGRLPRLRAARAELRATASALPRANPTLDPATLDEAEFARLTRRALSHFGDLSRLAASPLINLSLVERRIAARCAPDDALERAAELKAVLAEGIARLKPRTGGDFGASDEWRHYNALYFPYVVGLKPYSRRAASGHDDHTDPAAREALAWLRASVPERTLYNWQNAAALVARDLRARN